MAIYDEENNGEVETFNALLPQVYDSLNEEFGFQQTHGLSCDDFVRQSTGQATVTGTP